MLFLGSTCAASVIATSVALLAVPTAEAPTCPKAPQVVQVAGPLLTTAPDISTTGSLDKNIIRRVVRARINEVRDCYSQALEEDPAAAGRVNVQFAISPQGKVVAATATKDTLGNDDATACITDAALRWEFPEPKGGDNVLVTYPFVLEPS